MITNRLGGFNSQIGRWLSCYFAPCAGSWAAPGSHQRFEWRFIMMVCGTAAINQWPGLQSWPAQRTILGPGALPTASCTTAPTQPAAMVAPQQQQQQQQPGLLLAAAAPVVPFVARVPPRQRQPTDHPTTFEAAWEFCAKFEGLLGIQVCLVQDFLNIMHQDSRHLDQVLKRWKTTAPLCADMAHCFQLQRYTRVRSKSAWVGTRDAPQEVHGCFFV
jgi:hypothetical protein